VLDGLGQQILQILSQKLFAGPLDKLFDGIFESMTTSAKGNVFSSGRLLPFANGGVVTKPVIFPMAQGAGLMGEAGPEGILPLRRDSQGNLGVIAQGGPDGVEINIHNYSGQPVEQRQRQAGDGRTMIDLIFGAVKADLRQGGELAQTFQGTYGLSRRGY
jgi:phage-related minor tail protein